MMRALCERVVGRTDGKAGVVLACAVALGAGLVDSAQAAGPINYFTGFEQPAFGVGQNVPSSGTLSGWFRLDGSPTSTALPQVNIGSINNGGSQGLRIQNLAPYNQVDPGSVTYAIAPVYTLAGTNNVVANGTPYVHVQWDMRVDDPADGDLDKTSDTWCMDVYDFGANNRTMSVARGVELISGQLVPKVYVTGSNGEFSAAAVGAGEASGVWGTYAVDLNYLARTYSVSLNNVVLASNLPMYTVANNGIDLNFTVNGRGLDAAYFDNFLVQTYVPEPAGAMVVAALMAALSVRSRQSTR